jgi:proline racemase
MKCDYLVTAVDTHTEGTPTRIVFDPLTMSVPGIDMQAKQNLLKEKYDFIRKALMLEPRGYSAMTGAILTHPVSSKADFGLIFMDTEGYFNLCGHAIVGAATAAYELSWISLGKPEIIFDTIAGQISVGVTWKDGKIIETTMKDAPAFSFGQTEFELSGATYQAEIAYCGNIFALLEASDFNIPTSREFAREWSQLGQSVRDRLNATESLMPLTSGRPVKIVNFSAIPDNPKADFKSIVMFGQGQIDREPCGTCTCAKMASLFKKGKLNVGDPFLQESIIGTYARATIVGTTEIEGQTAIVSSITYKVFVTGIHQFLIDDSDALKEGYLLPV